MKILFGGDHISTGHWICIFFDAQTQMINVYDSLYSCCLSKNQILLIQKLYPFISNLDTKIIFRKPSMLQAEDDGVSCGLFALYYLISIAKKK